MTTSFKINNEALDKLLQDSIDHYDNVKNLEIVKQSAAVDTGLMLPIPYFGNIDAYQDSKIRILTVGLNPSNREFQKGTKEVSWSPRFHLNTSSLKTAYLREQLNNYFEFNPYGDWFNNFEVVLNGADASYYKRSNKNIALHLDLCSPIATQPTWSKLGKQNKVEKKSTEKLAKEIIFKSELTNCGTNLFNQALQVFMPEIVIFGVGQDHLKFQFEFLNIAEQISCDPNLSNNPKKSFRAELKKGSGRKILFINGSSNIKPFGNFTKLQRTECGKLIADLYKGINNPHRKSGAIASFTSATSVSASVATF
jgi:hypothetical protein